MSRRIITDEEIQGLLAESKPLLRSWRTRLEPQAQQSGARLDQSLHRKLPITGKDGHQFCIHTRKSINNPLDFSIILTFIDADRQEYRLTRFNGKHPSQHTNKIEYRLRQPESRFRSTFHIHKATERYQLAGFDIDTFAEVTDRYQSFESALMEFVGDNGFAIEGDDERRLFQ